MERVFLSRWGWIGWMFFFGFLSITTGKELCWDLANYHYYMPYAFLHHREYIDFWPGSYFHQFLNPAFDLFTYGLIQFLPPVGVTFLMGALSGITFWILFRICYLLLNGRHAVVFSVFLAMLGFLGPTAWTGVGSFQQDNIIAMFSLGFIYYQLRYWQTNQKYYFILSAVIAGMGAGLKLTTGIYLIGGMFAILFMKIFYQEHHGRLILFLPAVFLGMLFTTGFWWLYQWQIHGNPFLPALNYFFQSPDFQSSPLKDIRFLPKNILQTFFYPFYFSWDGRTADVPFQDIRFIWVYMLSLACVLVLIFRAYREKLRDRSSRMKIWFFLFFVFSYIAWQYFFSIARYLVTLELLTPLMIFLLVQYLCLSEYFRSIILTIIYTSIIVLLIPSLSIRTPMFGSSYFQVKMPSMVFKIKNATVFVPYSAYAFYVDPRPQSYLIPFFPENWRFVGVPFLHGKIIEDSSLERWIEKNKRDHEEHFLMLLPAKFYNEMRIWAIHHHFSSRNKCEYVYSDRQAITNESVILCEM